MKVLITCPPMLGIIDHFDYKFSELNFQVTAPEVIQTLSVQELKNLVPLHDGWIIGDDPASREVFLSGKKGKLKAAVKWGVGIDNVDFAACKDLKIPVTNTPNMFGNEVADVAVGYVIALARETFEIDRAVRQGLWPKPKGISLKNKIVALVGFGNIGQNVAKRLIALGMKLNIYDPFYKKKSVINDNITFKEWPAHIEYADFLVITCSLNKSNLHMINNNIFNICKKGIRVVNVSRGSVIDENSLISALKSGVVYSAALDVFETEPLPLTSALREHARCIFGSHNASNTIDAVIKTSYLAIDQLYDYLKQYEKK